MNNPALLTFTTLELLDEIRERVAAPVLADDATHVRVPAPLPDCPRPGRPGVPLALWPCGAFHGDAEFVDSFSVAAKVVGCTPSAISQAVARLPQSEVGILPNAQIKGYRIARKSDWEAYMSAGVRTD